MEKGKFSFIAIITLVIIITGLFSLKIIFIDSYIIKAKKAREKNLNQRQYETSEDETKKKKPFHSCPGSIEDE